MLAAHRALRVARAEAGVRGSEPPEPA
jgi:hypothetical protein